MGLRSALTTRFWRVSKNYRETEAGRQFAGLDQVMDLPVPEKPASSDENSVVFRHQINGVNYYVKRFHSTGGVRSWLGFSRLRGEWNNLKLFASLGIPAARLVAYGEDRILTLAGKGALITQELKGTEDLARLARNKDTRLADPEWVRKVTFQIADIARKLHEHKFAHNDFKWRNIMVSDDISNPEVFLIDCPVGQRWIGPLLHYRIIKDLACLDKVAKYNLSRTQRLRFFLRYRNQARLTPADKLMIQKIVVFFEGRE